MPRIGLRALSVLSASAIVGVGFGLAINARLHAHPQAPAPADAPAPAPVPLQLDPDFATPLRASHRIRAGFPTAAGLGADRSVILPRDAAGRVTLDIARQGFNNDPTPGNDRPHRALVLFYPAVPRGEAPRDADLVPLHKFELPARTLRAGGVDNFNVATRESFPVPPGDYSLVAETLGKDSSGAWVIYSSNRYRVSVR